VQGFRLRELPDEISDMTHLRYLRLDSKVLQGLPCSINRLVNLQTLDIRRTPVKEIDAMFWTIKTLRHVLTEKLMLPAAATLVEEMGNLMTLHGVTPGKEDWEGQGRSQKSTIGVQSHRLPFTDFIIIVTH
jgi:Leucine-rich repeat (LRR) protein